MKIRLIIISSLLFAHIIIYGQTNLFINAQLAYQNNQFEQAVSLLNQHILAFPKHNKAIILRAKSNLELKNYQLAIDDISKLNSTSNDEINLLFARAYAGLSNNELALEQLDKYLGSTSKIPEPDLRSYPEFSLIKSQNLWANLWKTTRYTNKEIVLNNAKFAIRSGNNAEATDRLNEYLSKYSKNAEAFYMRANIYFLSKEYKLAIEDYNSAVQLKPENQDYLTGLANCNNKLSKFKVALELFDKVLTSDSLYLPANLGRAESLSGIGEFERAKSDISHYRSYYPFDEDAQFLEAKIDTKDGDFLNAIANYGQLIKAHPGKPEYFIARANAYLATKTYKYAVKDYSMALDLDPKNIEVFKAKAKAHQLNGELKQACYDWKSAARLGDIESIDNLYKYGKQFGIEK